MVGTAVFLSSGCLGTRKNVHMACTNRPLNYANEPPGLLGGSKHEVRIGSESGHLYAHRPDQFVLFSKAGFRPRGGKGTSQGPARAWRTQERISFAPEPNLIKERAGVPSLYQAPDYCGPSKP